MELLTYRDIAAETGIAVGTLRVWRNRGKLPDPTVDKGQPLWARKDIDRWIQQRSQQQPTD